jgi:hypothetical protein
MHPARTLASQDRRTARIVAPRGRLMTKPEKAPAERAARRDSGKPGADAPS